MSEKQTDTALAGAVFTALVAVVCLSIGVSLVFSGGWALIVVGAAFFVYSLVIAFKRRSETLYYPDNMTSQLRK